VRPSHGAAAARWRSTRCASRGLVRHASPGTSPPTAPFSRRSAGTCTTSRGAAARAPRSSWAGCFSASRLSATRCTPAFTSTTLPCAPPPPRPPTRRGCSGCRAPTLRTGCYSTPTTRYRPPPRCACSAAPRPRRRSCGARRPRPTPTPTAPPRRTHSWTWTWTWTWTWSPSLCLYHGPTVPSPWISRVPVLTAQLLLYPHYPLLTTH
jgi:hypothetical protein